MQRVSNMKSPEKSKLTKLLKERLRYEHLGRPRKEAEICSKIARLYFRNGMYKEAIEAYKDEMQLYGGHHNPTSEAMCNRSLGECYAEVGLFPLALIHHNHYMSWAQSHSNYTELQRALATLGRTYLCKAASVDEKGGTEARTSLAKSEEAFLKSMTVIDQHLSGAVSENELSQMKARLYLNLGLVYMHQENYPESIASIEKAIRISQDHHKMEDLYRGQLSLGDVYLRMTNTSKSLQALDIAFSLSKKLKDRGKECDVLVQRAHIHFMLSEFASAEGVLRRVCAIGAVKPAEKPNIIEQIKTAKRCTRLEMKLKTAMEDVNLKRVMEIHEKLGDCCCKLNIFREALLHYNKQLECALTLQLPDEQLSPIYVSLGATYADSQQYGMAVTMYAKELQLREGNSMEECKTWLNIADAQEKAGHSYEALQESYGKATKFAVNAQNPKLQRRVLKSLAIVQERFGQSDHLAATKGKLAKLNIEYNLVSEDDNISEEGQTMQAQSSDEEDSEDFDLLINPPHLRGDTTFGPIDANQKEAEAEDVLNMWLDTDHDELPHGSNLTIKIEPGLETASCSLTSDNSFGTKDSIATIKTEPLSPTLHPQQNPERWSAVSKKGKTLLSRTTTPMKRHSPVASTAGSHKIRKKPGQMNTTFSKVSPRTGSAKRKQHRNRGKTAERLHVGDRNVPQQYVDYQTGRNIDTSSSDSFPELPSDNHGMAFHGGGDSGGQSRVLMRSVSDSGVASDGNGRYPDSSGSYDCLTGATGSDHSEQVVQGFSNGAGGTLDEDKGVSPDSSLPQGPNCIEERVPSIAFIHPPRKPTMRVRVKLKETTHLVNVPLAIIPPATFQWLAERVAVRFEESSGVRASLSLSTSDGALISREDVVSDTLSENEEVIADVVSYNEPRPSDDGLLLANQNQNDDTSNPDTPSPVPDAESALTKPVSSTILRLCQRSLQVITMSRSQLSDQNLQELAEVLREMPHIWKIDLSHNQVTHNGLQGFCEILFPEREGQRSPPCLAGLRSMNLSGNPLTDGAAVSIANLIRNCPQLKELNLSSTQLTTQFVTDQRAAILRTAFEGASNLRVLDVSHNALQCNGVDRLLRFLKPEVITTLILSSVIHGEPDERCLTSHLAAYFSGGDCSLTTLSLEGCHLKDEDMDALSGCIPFTKSWISLNLSSNPGITNQGLLTLLLAWNSANCCVRSLDLSNCGLESPLGQSIITQLVQQMAARTDQSQTRTGAVGEHRLTSLKLSGNKLDEGDLELLKGIWVLAHRKEASILVNESRCNFGTRMHEDSK